ncbi:MAG TPA: nucleotide exchange factor GrpE [Stellaceae bacterium]|jgi:molecular chaperone GrpE|nr:nucleotide exchange factor GrpE [Stellaceae bacterium]
MIDDKDEAAIAAAGAPPANDTTELPDEGVETTPDQRLATVEAELAEAKDRLLRALAEAENTRRRFQREREDTLKYAISGFAKELLSPVDNLRRALESLPESEVQDQRVRSLLEGIAATERELLGAFERNGLRRIDPKGERFDHNFHQAIFEAERPDMPAGTVVEVLQPGYVLHDRLLRPAMVGVAKGGAKPVAEDNESAA